MSGRGDSYPSRKVRMRCGSSVPSVLACGGDDRKRKSAGQDCRGVTSAEAEEAHMPAARHARASKRSGARRRNETQTRDFPRAATFLPVTAKLRDQQKGDRRVPVRMRGSARMTGAAARAARLRCAAAFLPARIESFTMQRWQQGKPAGCAARAQGAATSPRRAAKAGGAAAARKGLHLDHPLLYQGAAQQGCAMPSGEISFLRERGVFLECSSRSPMAPGAQAGINIAFQ